MQTAKQKEATLNAVKAIAAAIRDLGSVPSGHLYARVMGFLSLDQYNSIIRILKNSHLINERHFELHWIGPKKS